MVVGSSVMSVVLVRVDDRLIHGQVTIGWGSYLNPDKIVLISDEIAGNPWEKELYEKSVPFNIAVAIYSEEDAAEAFKSNIFKDERIIVLVESPDILVRLVKSGVRLNQVNIGGMHFTENKRKLFPYVYVNDDDLQCFKFLAENDIELLCQDLPQAKKENLIDLL